MRTCLTQACGEWLAHTIRFASIACAYSGRLPTTASAVVFSARHAARAGRDGGEHVGQRSRAEQGSARSVQRVRHLRDSGERDVGGSRFGKTSRFASPSSMRSTVPRRPKAQNRHAFRRRPEGGRDPPPGCSLPPHFQALAESATEIRMRKKGCLRLDAEATDFFGREHRHLAISSALGSTDI
jgi:hypothetical protein